MSKNKNKKYRLLERDHFQCQYCGTMLADKIQEVHLDHKIPQSKGGGDEDENLFISCAKCNCLKGALDIEQFREKICSRLNSYIIELNKYTNKNYNFLEEEITFTFEQ